MAGRASRLALSLGLRGLSLNLGLLGLSLNLGLLGLSLNLGLLGVSLNLGLLGLSLSLGLGLSTDAQRQLIWPMRPQCGQARLSGRSPLSSMLKTSLQPPQRSFIFFTGGATGAAGSASTAGVGA